MCKVFAMTNMKKVSVSKKFVKAVRTEVCRTGDRHGFGYAVLSEDGAIAGERTLKPFDWAPMMPDPKSTMTGRSPLIKQTRDRFGELDFDNAKAFIAHGRYSTNDIALENTHPFASEDLALIHNGVVSDPDGVIPEKELLTTNDTEIIFRCWEKGGINKVTSTVSGYYALAVLEKTGVLHIVRDDRAPLYMAYSRTVDSFIFATSADIIKNVCKKMQWNVEAPEELKENLHAVFDRNEILTQTDIIPRADKWSATLSGKASAAFGTGSSRSYEGYGGGYYGSHGYRPTGSTSTTAGAGTVVDATKAPVVVETAPEAEPVPSYREDANQGTCEVGSFNSAVEDGEADRRYIEDGAPQIPAGLMPGWDQGEDSVMGNGIDEMISDAVDNIIDDARKIS